MIKNVLNVALFGGIFVLAGCAQKTDKAQLSHEEDTAAKKMFQGIWLNEDEGDVAFRVNGDTIYYPDSTSRPVCFYIASDTLVMQGANVAKYPIVKQAAHVFQFKVQSGDIIKLVKTNDKSYMRQFLHDHPVVLNQKTLVKRDTILSSGEDNYHLYAQVNPTSYKVYKSSFNEDGVEVDNVYYDNIVNVNIFQGARKLFGRDFHKEDFANKVPDAFLKQAILSDIVFKKVDVAGFHYQVVLAMPDSSMSYQVEIIVSKDGTMTIKAN